MPLYKAMGRWRSSGGEEGELREVGETDGNGIGLEEGGGNPTSGLDDEDKEEGEDT